MATEDGELECCVCQAPSTHAVTGLVSGTKTITTVYYCKSCYKKPKNKLNFR